MKALLKKNKGDIKKNTINKEAKIIMNKGAIINDNQFILRCFYRPR